MHGNVNYKPDYIQSDYNDSLLFENVYKDNFFPFNYEVYDIEHLLHSISSSRFKVFFKNLSVDTPTTLNKIKSLRRLRGLTDTSRLSLYLSKSGKKNSAMNNIMLGLFKVVQFLKISNYTKPLLPDWRFIYITLSNIGFSKNHSFQLSENSFFKKNNLLKEENLTITDLLYQNFKEFNLLFSFYVYKVDKQIYKNSRGKSGKYTFVWKYVPFYKRKFLIMHWLAKEIRISPGKTLQDRVNSILFNFIVNMNSTWIWKIKRFSLNYVYFNLRRTLGETCRTVMR